MDVQGVAFDTFKIGNAAEFLKWLQDHPLTRYKDGMYSLLGLMMVMEGIGREAAYDRKRYLIKKVKFYTPLLFPGLPRNFSTPPSDVKFEF